MSKGILFRDALAGQLKLKWMQAKGGGVSGGLDLPYRRHLGRTAEVEMCASQGI